MRPAVGEAVSADRQRRLPGARAGTCGGMGFQVTEVQKALKGVDYPASQEELARHAESNGAPDELVSELRDMDKDSFDGPNAVMHELKGSLGGPA